MPVCRSGRTPRRNATQRAGLEPTWQRQIDGGSLAAAGAYICQLACAWVGALLMCAYKQNILVLIEYIIRPVAMMHIKVKNHHLQ